MNDDFLEGIHRWINAANRLVAEDQRAGRKPRTTFMIEVEDVKRLFDMAQRAAYLRNDGPELSEEEA